MLGAEARAAISDDAGDVGAFNHRTLVESQRAMLPHGLDDEARVGIEPGPVHREAGRRQACLLELQLGRDL